MKQKKSNSKDGVSKWVFAWKTRIFFLACIFITTIFGIVLSNSLIANQPAFAKIDILQPAPTQPVGYYDYFGKLLSPQEASQLVSSKGLDPQNPTSYEKIGAVQITKELIAQGEDIFFNRALGDLFGLQGVFGVGQGSAIILDEITAAIVNLQGQPTNNLKITLQKDVPIGSRILKKGTSINTGLKLEKGSTVPIGTAANGQITCAFCHVNLSKEGKRLPGVANGEIAFPLFLGLAPNSSAAFSRTKLDPLDPKYQGDGKTIIDSKGNLVKLPDPQKFEKAFDDILWELPFGNFESSTDGIKNTTQIPNNFTFKTAPYTASGEAAVGPFAGLSAFNSAVHSSETNILGAYELIAKSLKIDPEVYLGTILQNAADARIRLPEGFTVKPSDWLRTIAPDPNQAELQDQIVAPGVGNYPDLKANLLTANGLIFSPPTANSLDNASGKFMFANNAMSAFQNSLIPPANQTPENWQALNSNSVKRGAKVFEKANCATCHIPPFFTDNTVHPVEEIGTNPARAKSRLALANFLVPPKLYSFNNPVPIPADADVLDVPTPGTSTNPNTQLPNGGYKTTPLRGLYLNPPYLHDGGVAVRAGSLKFDSNGNFSVVDPTGLGLPGTLRQSIPADAASSLRALVDRKLRAKVIRANKADADLVSSNLDGTGHEFYVDSQAGFNSQQQTDLVNFLLALDDNPGKF
ncbi:hypothetical protein [Nostoc sp. FACHB-110]|uniref:hypothetical protein n=1 Tax=Nostoc sp. FACHB-110 TaxID=2692834 RepID=UPI0016822732|nr:hypothetical protein [Nostoc sp. FACHB-110]MBD2439224.1 hypothetical protein [Nostoc sp. FACHB-110]